MKAADYSRSVCLTLCVLLYCLEYISQVILSRELTEMASISSSNIVFVAFYSCLSLVICLVVDQATGSEGDCFLGC